MSSVCIGFDRDRRKLAFANILNFFAALIDLCRILRYIYIIETAVLMYRKDVSKKPRHRENF